MSDDPVSYIASPETDEGRCRTALRQITYRVGDFKFNHSPEHMRQLLVEIRFLAEEVLSAPRSNGAAIDALEKELGQLRGELLDHKIRSVRMKAERPSVKRGPFERLVSSKIGSRAARLDAWLLGKVS